MLVQSPLGPQMGLEQQSSHKAPGKLRIETDRKSLTSIKWGCPSIYICIYWIKKGWEIAASVSSLFDLFQVCLAPFLEENRDIYLSIFISLSGKFHPTVKVKLGTLLYEKQVSK